MKRFAILLAAWLGLAGVCCAQDALDGGSWSGKITATADAPGGSLTDFFYVVQIDSSQTQFWAAVQNDGDDVRATIGGTQVPCWVDPATFNYAGTSCIVYVMRSGAASSAPTIAIYFGNAAATLPSTSATYGQFNTFPTSLKAFYPRGGGNDVTTNVNHLTMTGSPTVGGVAGPISGSLATDFNGTTQYGTANASVPTGAALTILASSYPKNSTGGNAGGTSAAGNTTHYRVLNMATSNEVRAFAGDGGPNFSTTSPWVLNAWNNVGGLYTSNTSRQSALAGVLGTANTASRTPTVDRICIGANVGSSASGYANQRIGFFGLYGVALSADWIAYWHSMLDPGNASQSNFYNGWTYSAISAGAQTLPVAHWKLDESSGAMVDVVNGYNLTEQSGTIDAATGKVNGARDFEAGDTEYADVADNANLSGGNRTFGGTCWLRPETTSGVVADKGWQNASDANREWVLYFSSGTELRFTMQNSGAIRDLTCTNVSLSAGNWYFVAFWYDAAADLMKISINNNTVQTLADTNGSYDGTRAFRLGASPDQSLYGDCIIDEFSWFAGNYPDAAQLTRMYNGGNGRAYPWSYGGLVLKSLLLSRVDRQQSQFDNYGVYSIAP